MGDKRIELSDDEVLVLGNWLHRFNESGEAAFEDQAEQRCLWNLEALLEKQNDAIFSPSHGELLVEARKRLRDDLE